MRPFLVFPLLLSAAAVSAQPQFASGTKDHLSSVDLLVGDVRTLGDVDGDGDQDLLGSNGILCLNDGLGRFTDAPTGSMPVILGPCEVALVGDVDGNGTLDLFLGMGETRSTLPVGTKNVLLLNDGAGRFRDASAASLPGFVDKTDAAALVDVNGDGSLDLILGNRGQDRVLLNSGTGVFRALNQALPVSLEWTGSIAAADLDGDGDPDLVLGRLPGVDQLLLNNGRGTFTVRAAQTFPRPVGVFTSSVVTPDIDGDGDADLLFCRAPIALYENDGLGNFTDVSSRLPVGNRSAKWASVFDKEGDGDLDLVLLANSDPVSQAPSASTVLENSGTGQFRDVTPSVLVPRDDFLLGMLSGDLDGNGSVDLIWHRWGRSSLFFSRNGQFREVPNAESPIGSVRSVVLDADGDGAMDVLVSVPQFGHQLWHNDGDGHLVAGPVVSSPLRNMESLVAGDVDGDGDTDVMGCSAGRSPLRQVALVTNDGPGRLTFTQAASPIGAASYTDIELGDVDGDGDLDVVLATQFNNPVADRLYLNDGAGTFTDVTATQMPRIPVRSTDVLMLDVDRDGDLDIVLGISAGQDRLYLNDGAGIFTDATATNMPPETEWTLEIAAGDVDGDGDPDMFLATTATGITPGRLYLNDGNGKFTFSPGAVPTGTQWAAGAAMLDLDGDGDLDLLLCMDQPSSQGMQAYRNDGAGRFVEDTTRVLGSAKVSCDRIDLVDLDGDGDLDLLPHGSEGTREVLFNRRRQLRNPWLARLGQPFRFDLHLRPGVQAMGQRGLLYLSLDRRASATPTPFGNLWLGARGLTPVGPVPIDVASGIGRIQLMIPNQPSLNGIRFHSQALLAPGTNPADWRLSNPRSDLIGF